jgi:hypothetical protein
VSWDYPEWTGNDVVHGRGVRCDVGGNFDGAQRAADDGDVFAFEGLWRAV